MKRLCL